ncbi:hypothetical protein KCU93_g101, partial [Aureobasidium melanogenum]
LDSCALSFFLSLHEKPPCTGLKTSDACVTHQAESRQRLFYRIIGICMKHDMSGCVGADVGTAYPYRKLNGSSLDLHTAYRANSFPVT